MITPASHQPSAMGKPPRMNQRRLNKKRNMAFSSFRKWEGSKRAGQPRKTASPAGGGRWNIGNARQGACKSARKKADGLRSAGAFTLFLLFYP